MAHVRRSARSAETSSLIEKVYYEAKPVILALLAVWGLNSAYSHTFYVKLNIFFLFLLAAHLTHSRLVHRGYLAKK